MKIPDGPKKQNTPNRLLATQQIIAEVLVTALSLITAVGFYQNNWGNCSWRCDSLDLLSSSGRAVFWH